MAPALSLLLSSDGNTVELSYPSFYSAVIIQHPILCAQVLSSNKYLISVFISITMDFPYSFTPLSSMPDGEL